jgi:hypothetical protein
MTKKDKGKATDGEADLKLANLMLVLGYIATKDLSSIEEKVAVLARLGYSNADMVTICNSTSSSIRTIKSRILEGASND